MHMDFQYLIHAYQFPCTVTNKATGQESGVVEEEVGLYSCSEEKRHLIPFKVSTTSYIQCILTTN